MQLPVFFFFFFFSVFGHPCPCLLPQCLMPPNLAGWCLTSTHNVTLPLGDVFARSDDILKMLYLPYHDICDNQTWQGCDLPWWGPTHKITWALNHVVLWDHETSWNHYTSNTTMPMTTKLVRGLTYHKEVPPIRSHDQIIRWFLARLRDYVYPLYHYISSTIIPVATKFGRV